MIKSSVIILLNFLIFLPPNYATQPQDFFVSAPKEVNKTTMARTDVAQDALAPPAADGSNGEVQSENQGVSTQPQDQVKTKKQTQPERIIETIQSMDLDDEKIKALVRAFEKGMILSKRKKGTKDAGFLNATENALNFYKRMNSDAKNALAKALNAEQKKKNAAETLPDEDLVKAIASGNIEVIHKVNSAFKNFLRPEKSQPRETKPKSEKETTRTARTGAENKKINKRNKKPSYLDKTFYSEYSDDYDYDYDYDYDSYYGRYYYGDSNSADFERDSDLEDFDLETSLEDEASGFGLSREDHPDF